MAEGNPENLAGRRPRLLGLLVPVAIVIAIGLLALLIWLPPHLLDTKGLGAEARLKAENDLRGTLAGVLGGLAILGGSVVAALGLRETTRQNRRAAQQNREQLDVARQQNRETAQLNRDALEVARRGQVTERFTRAIDQLGSTPDIRLGGIYGLEQIAIDSDDLWWPVMEVLTAFLREKSSHEDVTGPPLRSDFQAIATVLGRRRAPGQPHHTGGSGVLDLRGVKLPGVKWSKAELGGARLSGAHLEEANLSDANLEWAVLAGAHLQKAYLGMAHLRGVYLAGARLEGADLTGAHLDGVDLADAHLEGAKLSAAHLGATRLAGAHLEGADFSRAEGLSREAMRDAVVDETTILPVDIADRADHQYMALIARARHGGDNVEGGGF